MHRLLLIEDDARLAVVRHPPDMVLMDVMLPDGDGLALTAEWRQSPRTSSLPILMLTARGDPADRILGLELGADDYLAKPFE
ncbi:MAG: response regulator transcription factor, partial [Betaproteobacteria bacterium]